MHKYLRSIGFRSFSNERLDKLYYYKKENPDYVFKTLDSEGNSYIEYRAEIASGIGISFRGRQNQGDRFRLEYYFPYLVGGAVSTREEMEIIKESDREGYHGLCDELNLGVELIFFLQDMLSYTPEGKVNKNIIRYNGVRLGALASEGTILMPVKQTVGQIQRVRESSQKRTMLMAAAREGDERAMEKLAREEMDQYAYAAKRAEKEDIYSIVNTFFMPEGIESDKYSILGLITGMKAYKNAYTNEDIYVLTLSCNRVRFDVCINKGDLLGEPAVGRRLKANIWMQGMINVRAG